MLISIITQLYLLKNVYGGDEKYSDNNKIKWSFYPNSVETAQLYLTLRADN